MSSDLTSNLISGLYSLFAHNGEVIAYVLGAILTLAILFFRPRRLALVFFLAFATLAFNFEYDKHLMLPLRNQTIATVVADPGAHLFTQRILNLILTEAVPVVLFLVGWGLLFLAILTSLMGSDFLSQFCHPRQTDRGSIQSPKT